MSHYTVYSHHAQNAKRVDFSATRDKSMRGVILRFVHGIHDKRQEPVTMKQIQHWFLGTPAKYVAEQVDALLDSGLLLIVRTGKRKTCGYRYVLTNNGAAAMYGHSYWDSQSGRQEYQINAQEPNR